MATPLALGQVGQMVMILIDTYMLGKLGPEAIGGAGLGSALFYVFTLFSAGTLFGLDYLVSHAYGRKDVKECHYWLVQAVYLSFLLGLPLVLLLQIVAGNLPALGFDPTIAVPARAFLSTLSWSLLPFLVFISFRQYLQAMSNVHAGTVITIVAVALNAYLNWVLIFGNLGAKAFGVAGAGVATTISRTLMAAVILVYALHRDKRLELGLSKASLAFDTRGMKRLLQVGLPAGGQLLFESGVFSLATTLIVPLGAISLAAHTIVLNLAGLTYMVPYGIAASTAVLVGQALGEGNPVQARLSGWTSIGLGASVMACFAVIMFTLGAPIVGLFSQDAGVIELGRRLLMLAAVFQVADGIQSVGCGALRGLGNTRAAMVGNFLGYWILGLPIGYYLCFSLGLGVLGFWGGLTAGIFAVAAYVLWNWVQGTKVNEALA